MSNLVIDRYIQLLIDDEARLRVPELLGAPHAAALYQVPNRECNLAKNGCIQYAALMSG
jgi:hypothetical protein